MENPVDQFNAYRSRMNEKLLAENSKLIKRIFNLDTNAYMPGALDTRTKELLSKCDRPLSLSTPSRP